MKRVIVIALALTAAAAAWAGLGSVISSFPLSYPGYEISGGYVEGDYIYFVADNHQPRLERKTYTLKYTRDGSFVGSFLLDYGFTGQDFGPCACDNAHLGAGYFFVGAEYLSDSNGIFQITTGSLVQSISPVIGDTCWDGNYYYYTGAYMEAGYIGRFTTSGSFLDDVYFPGWPLGSTNGIAYASVVNGVAGHYLVCTAAGGYIACYADLGTRSVVGTFALPVIAWTATYAPSYPSGNGMTLWVTKGYTGPPYCYQIDLGNGNLQTITPASLGRIKAVYR